jgi:tetratricopeptide (TPR) repeat protein
MTRANLLTIGLCTLIGLSAGPVRSHSNDAPFYQERAKYLYSRGDLRGAIENYNRAIALVPHVAFLYVNRGIALQRLEKSDEARKDYDFAERLDPSDWRIYFNRGNLHAHLGEMKEAIADYTHTILLKPNYAPAYCGRGVAREEHADETGREDYQLSIADYSKAVELDPQLFLGYYSRGRARSSIGDKVGAAADYIRALVLNPEVVGSLKCYI